MTAADDPGAHRGRHFQSRIEDARLEFVIPQGKN